jgi:hypothetical protein
MRGIARSYSRQKRLNGGTFSIKEINTSTGVRGSNRHMYVVVWPRRAAITSLGLVWWDLTILPKASSYIQTKEIAVQGSITSPWNCAREIIVLRIYLFAKSSHSRVR